MPQALDPASKASIISRMIKNPLTVLLLVGGVLATGCDRRPEPYRGIVEHDERVLGFDTGGRVERVARRGDAVERGAAVAGLDVSLATHARDARAAELAAAEARLALVRSGGRNEDARAIAAQLDAARSGEELARRTAERMRSLEAAGAAPAATREEAEAALAKARAEVRVLEERSRAVAGGRPEEIAAADAAVRAAAAVLALEDERLARATLSSPLAGRVVEVLAETGEVVGAGMPVVRVADTKHPYVDVFVPQQRLPGIGIGDAATIGIDGTSEAWTGSVEDVGRRTEFTPRFLFSESERANLVVRVRVRIDDPHERLHAGVPAEVRIATGSAAGAREVAKP